MSGTLEPGSTAIYTRFTVGESTAFEWTQDTDALVNLSGPYSETADGVMLLEPCEYT